VVAALMSCRSVANGQTSTTSGFIGDEAGDGSRQVGEIAGVDGPAFDGGPAEDEGRFVTGALDGQPFGDFVRKIERQPDQATVFEGTEDAVPFAEQLTDCGVELAVAGFVGGGTIGIQGEAGFEIMAFPAAGFCPAANFNLIAGIEPDC